jgi:hypothetical protein
MWRIYRAPNSIPIYIQQVATLHSLFISWNCSTCFGWYFHPSSGAHTTVSTASGICHTVTAICPLSWKSWNWLECAVGGVRHPQHTQTGSRCHPQHTQTSSSSCTIAADSSNGVTNTRCCRYAPDDRWKYHPKHVEQFPDINKLCNFASCWIYIGIYLRCTDP